MKTTHHLYQVFFYIILTVFVHAQNIDITTNPSPDTFPIVSKTAADIVFDQDDAAVVGIAANLFAEDMMRVANQKPSVLTTLPAQADEIVVIGTIGESRYIDALIDSQKLDVSAVKDQWEAFTIATVDYPFNGIEKALVIAGSDRRGTAYGVFSISEAVGVSPWYDWADVPTPRKEQLYISTRTVVQGSPSVRYRGIFINDEDFGLKPWASKHLDTDIKDIGPKTYAKVFELLLRLKANYIWPAMHGCTKAFNIYPENKIVADRYAIVMGASHCEPMLRNNVTEWNKQTMGPWNYETNRDAIYSYWDSRVKENGQFENVYTVGMRGIHDSGIPGGGSDLDKKNRLERIIGDQRNILSQHVNPDPAQVPQIFCPYKEVLNIYKLGMKLPDDITLVWPDDNHGYIRNLSTPVERKRSGGSGIYYHCSYWGRPQDYLWIGSTSPAKISYEMNKAYAYGADRLWVFNVGDIKPIEMEMEFALRLAYDVDRWPAEKAMDFIEAWAERIFGSEYARDIASVKKEYYRLTQQARPEHIDRVTFSKAEQERRLEDYAAIVQQVDTIYEKIDPEYRDAFFQLVLYPVKGAALMNQKQTFIVQGNAQLALRAYEQIQELTHYYNKEMAGGKWDGIMDASPRNLAVFQKPDASKFTDQSTVDSDYLFRFDPADVKCTGRMQLIDNSIVATAPDMQSEDSNAKAIVTFDSQMSQKADLYFLAQCFDDKHDSWFVSLNDKKVLSNNQLTGTTAGWLKIMDVDIRQGNNELIITQREPGTRIKRIVLMKTGKVPAPVDDNPAFVFAADKYTQVNNTKNSQWLKVEGLGIEQYAMTLMPCETGPINEANVNQAPSLTYSFHATSDHCTVEARFLPTHRINEGMGLRFAVSVDNGPAQIRDIHAAEWSGTWSQNVLRGYSLGRTTHSLNNAENHTVTLFLLDPGMVLSQIRIFTEK